MPSRPLDHRGDTSGQAEAVWVAAIRARSPEARLRDAMELSDLMHGVAMTRLRARFPMASMVELALMVADDKSGAAAG